MRRGFAVWLSATLALAAAVPALADNQITGYFRTAGSMEMAKAIGQTDEAKPDTIVDQRLRARWQNNLNEYVSVVWFGELDTTWGKAGKGNIGNGGKQGADGVSIETKNAFVDVKLPGVPAALSTRLGIQPIVDTTFNSVLMNDDFAAATISAKTETVTGTLGWAKADEGPELNGEDDTDLYFLQMGIVPAKGFRLSPELWFSRNQPADVSEWYLGLGAAAKLAPVDLSAWVLYDGGTDENDAGDDTDLSGWAASAKASTEFSGLKAGLRVLYFSEDDSEDDRKSFNPPNGANGGLESFDEYLQIFLYDSWNMNGAAGRLALTDAAYKGYGLFGAILSASYTPPALKNAYARFSGGYFAALDDEINDAGKSREGKTLGTEVSLQVGYKVAEKVDFNLRGAYAFLGDFYDKQNVDKEDPDDLYKVALMVHVPY